MNIIVTSPGIAGALAVRASINIHIAHKVAEAFTDAREENYPLHDVLISVFGDRRYRWYCIDMSDITTVITFSDSANPGTLSFQGVAAAIATVDREAFQLDLRVAELVKPGRLNPNAKHIYHISE